MKPLSGLYRHWKGNLYRVLFTIRLEDLNYARGTIGVVYFPLYGNGELSIRTGENFFEHVERDGYSGPRFVRIGD